MADPQQRDRNPQRDFGARLSSFERAGFVLTGPEYPFKGAQALSRIVEQGGGEGLLFVQVGGVLRLATVADLPAHALLSAQHSDALVGAVLRGDLIVGNGTPAWARLALGAAGKYVGSDGTDALYRDLLESLIVRDSAVYGKLSEAEAVAGLWEFDGGITLLSSTGNPISILADQGADDTLLFFYDLNNGNSVTLKFPVGAIAAPHIQRLPDGSGTYGLVAGYVRTPAQTGAIAATNLVANTYRYMYRVTVAHRCSAAAVAGTLATTIRWTDETGAARSVKPCADVSLAATAAAVPLSALINVSSGTVITYETAITGAVGTPSYDLIASAEAL